MKKIVDQNKKNIFLVIFSFVIFFAFVLTFPFKKITENFANKNETKFIQENILENSSGFTGLEFGHTGRVWVNDRTGISGVYKGNGETVMTKDKNGEFVPLLVYVDEQLFAQVFSPEHSFLDDAFIFTTLSGKIYGWHKNKKTNIEETKATLRIDNSKNNSVYTGITLAKTSAGYRLYVADNFNNKIEMYDEKYKKINIEKSFVDPDPQPDFSVYNLKNINSYIYVTYKNNTNGEGGLINIFDLDGNFVKRLVINNGLNSPYGIALSTSNFGGFDVSDSLLVGNLGTGKINIYDYKTGEFKGELKNQKGESLIIPGLLALTFGTNNGAGRSTELFFSSSSDAKGIFGRLNLIVSGGGESKKDIVENISEEKKIEKDFLEENVNKISYQDFINNLNKDCLGDRCVEKRLEIKKIELENVYNKIFFDGEIIKNELKKQNLGEENVLKIDEMLSVLKKQDLKNWLEFTKNECEIYALNFYTGEKVGPATEICLLYKTENWLQQLYVLRSIFIRVEMSPVGVLSSVASSSLSESFKKIVDEEENRVEKAY